MVCDSNLDARDYNAENIIAGAEHVQQERAPCTFQFPKFGPLLQTRKLFISLVSQLSLNAPSSTCVPKKSTHFQVL